METKRPFNANIFDVNTGDEGAKIEIPAETSLALLSYDPVNSTVLFRVLKTDASAEPEYIICSYEHSYPGVVNGVPADELFHRLMYGG